MEEIEKAAKEAQEIIDKIEASDPSIHKMMNIVKKFLQHSRTMCYGGTAINNLLPKEKQFYDIEKDIPDYDFFTTTPQKHAKQIADILVRAGIKNVEVKPGMHLGTFKVFADYTGVADVSLMEHELFEELWRDRITKDDINYVPPNFLRMSVYLELSRPRGFVERWKKVYSRLKLLNEEYPIKCPLEEKEFHDKHIPSETQSKIEHLLKDTNVILLGFNAATFQADEQLKTWIFPLDLLCTPEHIDTLVKKLTHVLNFKHLKSESFHEYAEILPPHTDITLNNKLLVRIFETSACHSYHELQNKMKIASIPTLLNFFFAMIYADKEFIEHTSKDRIICSTQELIDLADNAGKRRYKLLTPITCTGKQKDLMDMKKEKSDLYEKLSTNKNSKAFLKYFFSYTPKHSFHGGRVIELSRMFPKKPGLDYTKLKLTPEGEYSITKSHDSLKIIEAMKKVCKVLKNKTIADLSGNVGGDTIRFGMNFKEVDSYELNPINFEALKNNVEIYDLKNVHLHLGDATKLFKKKVDFLYIDPPWGGPDYKDKEKLVLKFGDDNVDKYLKSILEQEWRPKYIFLKLPSNYDFNTFTELPNIHTTIHKFQIRGFYLLGIKTLN